MDNGYYAAKEVYEKIQDYVADIPRGWRIGDPSVDPSMRHVQNALWSRKGDAERFFEKVVVPPRAAHSGHYRSLRILLTAEPVNIYLGAGVFPNEYDCPEVLEGLGLFYEREVGGSLEEVDLPGVSLGLLAEFVSRLVGISCTWRP